MPAPLGRLVSVPLREVWAHEAKDFTPWLAETENLALLADTLQLGELQLQGTEVAVGNFSIDILARDIESRMVVIENQFGPTDHTHLGQIMTYLAGQDGRATVIWIAESIREEHRAAIDWLNASTIEDFNFFAVEVEALRIGNSTPAPWFNVVAKPNNWSRGVVRATRSADGGPLDDRAKAYVAYWSGFRDGKLSVEIYISHRAAKRAFDLLEAERDPIEAEFGAKLDWQRLNDKQGCRIAIYRTDLDPRDESQRAVQYEWFLDQMQRFSGVFGNKIRNLPLDEPVDADLAPASAEAAGG